MLLDGRLAGIPRDPIVPAGIYRFRPCAGDDNSGQLGGRKCRFQPGSYTNPQVTQRVANQKYFLKATAYGTVTYAISVLVNRGARSRTLRPLFCCYSSSTFRTPWNDCEELRMRTRHDRLCDRFGSQALPANLAVQRCLKISNAGTGPANPGFGFPWIDASDLSLISASQR